MSIRQSLRAAAALSMVMASSGLAQARPGFRADYHKISTGSIVQDKNFYLLTLFQGLDRVRKELAQDAELTAMFKWMATPSAQVTDSMAGKTAAATMTLSDSTIAAVRARLVDLVGRSAAIRALVNEHLRPSGTYQRFSSS